MQQPKAVTQQAEAVTLTRLYRLRNVTSKR